MKSINEQQTANPSTGEVTMCSPHDLNKYDEMPLVTRLQKTAAVGRGAEFHNWLNQEPHKAEFINLCKLVQEAPTPAIIRYAMQYAFQKGVEE